MNTLKVTFLKLKWILFSFYWLIFFFPSFINKMRETGILNVRPGNFFLWTTEVLFFTGRYKEENTFIKLYLDRRKNQRESRILECIHSISNGLLVPKFIDDGVYSGGYFVLLEKVEAKSLNSILGNITPETFHSLLDQFIYILGEFSRIGLVHCDITPDNIMVTKQDEIVIIDFEYSIFKGNPDYQDFSFARKSVLKALGGEHSMTGSVWDDAYSFLSIAKEIIRLNNFNENDFLKINKKFEILESIIGDNYHKE